MKIKNVQPSFGGIDEGEQAKARLDFDTFGSSVVDADGRHIPLEQFNRRQDDPYPERRGAEETPPIPGLERGQPINLIVFQGRLFAATADGVFVLKETYKPGGEEVQYWKRVPFE